MAFGSRGNSKTDVLVGLMESRWLASSIVILYLNLSCFCLFAVCYRFDE